jgi:hypothetical protein
MQHTPHRRLARRVVDERSDGCFGH